MRIQGLSVRDYAFRWAAGGCPIQQWAGGARGIDQGLIDHVAGLRTEATTPEDREGLEALLSCLKARLGEPASPYVPNVN
jgi:hypothetical protein